MKIDLKKIQLEIDNLDKTINRYEENLLNLYNQLLLTSIYCKDKNSLKFNENISQEKKEANIKLEAQGSSIIEINNALKTASKNGTGNVGFPE